MLLMVVYALNCLNGNERGYLNLNLYMMTVPY